MKNLPINNGFGAITQNELENIQETLVELLKEFDKICKENNITYYLDGGNAIGALRHKGFIPWDDDIDLMIKRDDFEKLKIVLEEYCKNNKDRLFVYSSNKDFVRKQFARFVRNDKLILMKDIMTIDYKTGAFIDIFILDGIEDRYLKKYTNTLEKAQEWFHTYLNGVVGTASFFEYLFSLGAEKLFGKRIVAKYYMKKLDSFEKKSKKIDFYIPRNGFNYGVYPARIFQEPKYVEFEGALFPVATRPQEHLRIHYSEDWFLLPEPESRFSHHFTLTSELFSPQELKDEFDWFEDIPKYRNTQTKRHIFQVLRKKFVVKRHKELIKANALKYELELKLLLEKTSIKELEELEKEENFVAIYKIFEPYYLAQKELLKIYSLAKYGICLPKEYLYFAIKSLFMCGNIFLARKYLALYENLEKKEAKLLEVLNSSLQIECFIQDEEFEKAKDELEKLPLEYLEASNIVVYRKRLGLLKFSSISDEIAYYETNSKNNGQNYELDKLIADCYFEVLDYKKAYEIYDEIIENHNNLLLIMEIKEKLDEK